MPSDYLPLDKIYSIGEKVRFIGEHRSDSMMLDYDIPPDIHDGDLGEVVYVEANRMVIAFKPRSWTPSTGEEAFRILEMERLVLSHGEYKAKKSYLEKNLGEAITFKHLTKEIAPKWIKKIESGGLEKITKNAK